MKPPQLNCLHVSVPQKWNCHSAKGMNIISNMEEVSGQTVFTHMSTLVPLVSDRWLLFHWFELLSSNLNNCSSCRNHQKQLKRRPYETQNLLCLQQGASISYHLVKTAKNKTEWSGIQPTAKGIQDNHSPTQSDIHTLKDHQLVTDFQYKTEAAHENRTRCA